MVLPDQTPAAIICASRQVNKFKRSHRRPRLRQQLQIPVAALFLAANCASTTTTAVLSECGSRCRGNDIAGVIRAR
ncbi:hypothetical protein WAI453_011206 [Rhynchosporium graminicola]